MTKKIEKPYTELDVIIQATADTNVKISLIAESLMERYETMSRNVAMETAERYYLLGVLAIESDPKARKKAEDQVKEQYKEREERIKKNNPEVEEK